MADNLLNKNKERRNLLERKEEVKPQQSFNRSSLFTVNESEHTNEDKKKDTSRKKIKSKTTTIRCAADTSHRLNAIVTSFNLDSVNELIEILLDNYEASLTTDERREIKTLLEVYQRKSKK
jgi:hypothetical protein